MKPVDREAALHKIRNDKKCRVILISFKAGGVGKELIMQVLQFDFTDDCLPRPKLDRLQQRHPSRPLVESRSRGQYSFGGRLPVPSNTFHRSIQDQAFDRAHR